MFNMKAEKFESQKPPNFEWPRLNHELGCGGWADFLMYASTTMSQNTAQTHGAILACNLLG